MLKYLDANRIPKIHQDGLANSWQVVFLLEHAFIQRIVGRVEVPFEKSRRIADTYVDLSKEWTRALVRV